MLNKHVDVYCYTSKEKMLLVSIHSLVVSETGSQQ